MELAEKYVKRKKSVEVNVFEEMLKPDREDIDADWDDEYSRLDNEYYKKDASEIPEPKKVCELPNIGDVVIATVPSHGSLEKRYVVIALRYQSPRIYRAQPTLIDAVEVGKGAASIDRFHISFVKEIIHRDYADQFDNWEKYRDKLILSQIPEVGKTAVVRKKGVMRLFTYENPMKIFGTWKFKIVKIRERGEESPLLVLKPTRHFSGEYFEADALNFYFS